MRTPKTVVVALALSIAFVAGCGGGGSSSVPAGASIVPKSVPVFISIDTKPGSPQWKQALALIRKFPGGKQALAQPMAKGVVSSLGDELDIVELDLQNGGNDTVALTKPANAAKLDASLGSSTAHTVVDGWTVFANSQAVLTRFEQARKSGSLSDDSVFKSGYGSLPSGALAKLFLRGSVLESKFQQGLTQSSLPIAAPTSALGKLDSITAALVPEAGGVKLNVDANGSLGGHPSTFTPQLPSQLPSGALAYFSFANLEGSLKSALARASLAFPQVDQYRAQLETLGGFSVDKDLLPLFGAEGGVVVYPGQTLLGADMARPAVDVVFKISDEAAARRVISGLARLAQASKKAHVTTSNGVTQVMVSKNTTISIGVFNGLLVVTNDASSLSAIKGVTVKLADDPTYKQAVQGSGLPSQTSGFFYLNTPLAVQAILNSQAKSSHRRVNPLVTAELGHLGGLLLYASKNGGNYDLTGFLGIK